MRKTTEIFANSGDPDQTLHSDLGLHCLPSTLLGISRLQWVKLMTTLVKQEIANKQCLFNTPPWTDGQCENSILTQFAGDIIKTDILSICIYLSWKIRLDISFKLSPKYTLNGMSTLML